VRRPNHLLLPSSSSSPRSCDDPNCDPPPHNDLQIIFSRVWHSHSRSMLKYIHFKYIMYEESGTTASFSEISTWSRQHASSPQKSERFPQPSRLFFLVRCKHAHKSILRGGFMRDTQPLTESSSLISPLSFMSSIMKRVLTNSCDRHSSSRLNSIRHALKIHFE